MMIEDGRRLLISNLDLSFDTRNIGGLLLESSSRKINRFGIEGQEDRDIHDDDDLYSLAAVEFYHLFPDAWDFRVSTAVRMSASFPFVSPAVSLPTLPPRRVVDAGYYDNYGINLSALWLAEMKDWLVENTSGVLIVQIRDYVSQNARTDVDFDRLDAERTGSTSRLLDRLSLDAGRNLISTGLQALSRPLSGAAAARQWTMSFRNDEQVELLNELFDDQAKAARDESGSEKNHFDKFFETVVFECPVREADWRGRCQRVTIDLGRSPRPIRAVRRPSPKGEFRP